MNIAWLIGIACLPSAVFAQCRLCANQAGEPQAQAARPLNIEIESALDLGRAANTRSGGSIALDGRTGGRTVAGLVDLGGFAIVGRVRISGEPFRRLRVTLPSTARLTATDGSVADAEDLRTDLPPEPQLDGAGILSFGFGGRLVVRGDAAGDFRGRIAITAEYQ